MLENSKYKLTHNQSFTVAYFGGSITEGAGSSDYAHCWAGLTTAWLQEKYPSCKINPIQAAIGGTGSLLGAYRCEEDVIRYRPDLVFFEYAVNDSAGNYDELINNCDAILRKLWKADPTTDVVMIYTTTREISDKMSTGSVYVSRSAFSTCSYYYGDIPQIDIGEALREKVLLTGGDWLTYTKEGVHPLDNGYRVYMDVLEKKLSIILEEASVLASPLARVLPAPMVKEGSHIGAHMESAWGTAQASGFEKVEKSLCGRYPHYIEATQPGAELTYTFTGSRLDLYWMMACDSGDIIYSIDGSPEKQLSAWDHYCLDFDRANSITLASGLPFGEHTLYLKVAESHKEGSTGYAIRIGAYLVL